MKNYHYEKCLVSIKGIARKWSVKTGLPFDDFVSEGNFAYAKCLENYDVNKGQFRPYLCSSAYNVMKDYADKFLNENWVAVDMEMPAIISNPEMETTFIMTLESLSEEAKEVIKTVLDSPAELIEMAKNAYNTSISKSVIKKYLTGKNWTHEKINNCFNEIKEVL